MGDCDLNFLHERVVTLLYVRFWMIVTLCGRVITLLKVRLLVIVMFIYERVVPLCIDQIFDDCDLFMGELLPFV